MLMFNKADNSSGPEEDRTVFLLALHCQNGYTSLQACQRRRTNADDSSYGKTAKINANAK